MELQKEIKEQEQHFHVLVSSSGALGIIFYNGELKLVLWIYFFGLYSSQAPGIGVMNLRTLQFYDLHKYSNLKY